MTIQDPDPGQWPEPKTMLTTWTQTQTKYLETRPRIIHPGNQMYNPSPDSDPGQWPGHRPRTQTNAQDPDPRPTSQTHDYTQNPDPGPWPGPRTKTTTRTKAEETQIQDPDQYSRTHKMQAWAQTQNPGPRPKIQTPRLRPNHYIGPWTQTDTQYPDTGNRPRSKN